MPSDWQKTLSDAVGDDSKLPTELKAAIWSALVRLELLERQLADLEKQPCTRS